MNKNALYYSIYLSNINQVDSYSMLYYSLQSIKNFYNNEFDIVVFYSTTDINFETYQHLEKYNLIRDFPFVKFIESDYATKYSNVYMHKWYNFEKVFKLGYDKVFYLDCDVFFTRSISYLFMKYSDHALIGLCEGYTKAIHDVLGRPGLPSGQIIVDKETFLKLDNLYEKILIKQNELIIKANKTLTELDANWFISLSEQYAAQMVFIDSKINIEFMDISDVCFGEGLFDIEIKNHEVYIVNIMNTSVVHYFGKNGYLVCPKELHTENMKKLFNSNIVDNKFIGHLF